MEYKPFGSSKTVEIVDFIGFFLAYFNVSEERTTKGVR